MQLYIIGQIPDGPLKVGIFPPMSQSASVTYNTTIPMN